MTQTIEVVDYDPLWPQAFEEIRSQIQVVLAETTLSIEHIGSTSVPGLAAKPIIDIDVIVASLEKSREAIAQLATLGYIHRGNLGIEGREAFYAPPNSVAHHLYVCLQDSLALKNHIAVRNHLRYHPEASEEYGVLKKTLAQKFPQDIDRYIDGKTDFILKILRSENLTKENIESIEKTNKIDSKQNESESNI